MLITKLFIPSPGKNLVQRPGLFDKLNEGLNRKLILVSAPAGFGKTTLISDWINQNRFQRHGFQSTMVIMILLIF
jgi:LuxR family maltose regulon positive regulatory protein